MFNRSKLKPNWIPLSLAVLVVTNLVFMAISWSIAQQEIEDRTRDRIYRTEFLQSLNAFEAWRDELEAQNSDLNVPPVWPQPTPRSPQQ